MFGRMFGRGKDESDQAVCAECGRTLLAGEWTQKVVDADGKELLICSLCGQAHTLSGAEPVAAGATPANNGRVRESREDVREPRPEARGSRTESDAFWRALKDKDTEIEDLHAQLARVEAEKQELAGRLALAGAPGAGEQADMPASAERSPAQPVPSEPLVPSGAAPDVAAAELAARPTGDSSEPGERTWGETPAEFAAELAALRNETPAADGAPVEPPRAEASATVFEDTQPIPAMTGERLAEIADAPAADPETALTPEPPPTASPATLVSSIAAETAALVADTPAEPGAGPAPAASTAPPVSAEPATPTAADLEAEATSLTLLQRGVDLLNVSRVPHKIAETNEQLGLPSVHVGFDGQATIVTFMWSMGWYRFHVDAGSGNVRMVDRGYDELTDLRPNAGVRADGTVQLAPAQISRAAAQHAQPEPQPESRSAVPEPAHAPAQPEPPSVAAQKPPEILSKSLLGQRSDDEASSWEKTQARDFDWDR